MDAAGGIYTSVHDLSQWVMVQLNNGKIKDKYLFSEKQHNEMWSLQTIIPATTTPPYNTHFSGYGLGWFLSDVKGYKQVTHTGGLEGMVTQVTLIPELNLGIIVLTNQQSGSAFSAITNTIKNSYLQLPYVDYVTKYGEREKNKQAEADTTTEEVWKTVALNVKDKKLNNNFNQLAGTYQDAWFGEITLKLEKKKLIFQSVRSPQLKGEVFFVKKNTYAVKWDNRYFHADAFIEVTFDSSGKANNLKMKAISPLTDFSYDFHDLDFFRK